MPRTRVKGLALFLVICASLLALTAFAVAVSADRLRAPAQRPVAPAVVTQLGIILDGSLSTGSGEWNLQKQGLAEAITADCFPKDGSVELTVVQIGNMRSLLEVGPVAIDAFNFAGVSGQVLAISRLNGLSPLACGLYRLADIWTAKPLTDTRSPASNSGGWTAPTLAYSLDLLPAVATDNWVQQYYGHGFALPTGTVIDGIQVRLDARRTVGASRTGVISVELSWDGGTSWTAMGYSTGSMTGLQSQYNVGGASNLWGHAWTLAELANLRVRVTSYCRPSGTGLTATRVYLDWLPVTMYYHYPSAFAPGVKQVINIASSGIPDVCCDDPASGYLCLQPLQSAIGALGYLSSTLQLDADQDRVVVEAIHMGALARNWYLNNIAWPQPAQMVNTAPPEFPTDVGWVRTVDSVFDFKQAIFYKLGICGPFTVEVQAEPTSCCVPLEVSFSGSAEGANEPYEFHWGFGDGGSSTEQNSVYTYNTAGTYTVTLTVTDRCGCVEQVVKAEYITVNELPTASFTAHPTSCCVPLTVYFTDTSQQGSNPISQWLWDFGDGGSSTEQNPSYTYSSGGLFDVTLTVTDEHGCSDTVVQSEYIAAHEVTADFHLDADSGCAPWTVNATDQSTATPGTIAAWYWDWGDGAGTSTEPNPSYTYECPGTYTVTLTVTDSHGCSSSYQEQVEASVCLAIDKSDRSDPVPATWHVYYDIIVTNNSPNTMANVLIKDTLPAGTYCINVPANDGWTCSAGVAHRTISSLLAGASVPLQLAVGTHSTAVGTVTNTVTAQSDCVVVTATETTTISAPPSQAGPTPQPSGVLVIQKGTFGYSEDTYVYRYAPDTNYFLAPQLKAGGKQLYAALLRFDLSPIPGGATIDSASLDVYAEGWSGMDLPIGAYAVTRHVLLMQTTWNAAQTGANWEVAGANGATDRRLNPESSILTHGPKQWYSFDLTALVQEWVSGAPASGGTQGLANNGVLLRAENNFPREFYFTSAEGGTVAYRPKLVVRYH